MALSFKLIFDTLATTWCFDNFAYLFWGQKVAKMEIGVKNDRFFSLTRFKSSLSSISKRFLYLYAPTFSRDIKEKVSFMYFDKRMRKNKKKML